MRGREPRNRPRTTHRVSGVIALLFLNLGTRRGVWSASRPGRLYPRERPGTHCTGGSVGPGAGLDRCGKSRPTGTRSPDRPVRSESLYRLRYPNSFTYESNGYNFHPQATPGVHKSRRLVVRATKFCTVATNIFSIINAVLFCTYKYKSSHVQSRKRQITSKVHKSFQDCESPVGNLLHVTFWSLEC